MAEARVNLVLSHHLLAAAYKWDLFCMLHDYPFDATPGGSPYEYYRAGDVPFSAEGVLVGKIII